MDFVAGFSTIADRFYVIDENVWDLYGAKLFADVPEQNRLIFRVHEDRKNLDSVMIIYDALIARAAKRNMTLISVGGGILQDITGFAASTLYRGINWIFVPTTLLAQADSCIGSKTSLNYKKYKNLIGTFFPPNEIFLNPAFTATLTEHDYFSGLGEIIKLYLMGGELRIERLAALLPALMQRDKTALLEAIKTSLEVKLSYLEGDEFDTGRRNLLNFGHCFGHALESTSNFEIPHGQAVLIGILFANLVARNRGLLSKNDFDRLAASIVRPAIVVKPRTFHLNAAELSAAMKMDKKRVAQGLALVMMTETGEMVKVNDLEIEELGRANEELSAYLNAA